MYLEDDLCKLLDWFTCNGMTVNPKKFQLMFLGLKREQELRLNINGIGISVEKHVQLLRVEIDKKLKFIRTYLICAKKSTKRSVLF